jgi:hypothetical protein
MSIVNPDTKVKLVPATKIVKGMKREFDDFKNNIDRKYAIYQIFSGIRKEFGYTVEKLIGSNQVILTKTKHTFRVKVPSDITMYKRAAPNETKTVVLYDSEGEGELADPGKFEQFVLKELRRVLRKARRMKYGRRNS